jgi:dihydroxy-acid dehydratase
VLQQGVLDGDCLSVTGETVAENVALRPARDREVIRPFAQPLKEKAGFLVLSGNLFDFGIMKTSVISEEFRGRYLSNPDAPGTFEARAVVFEGVMIITTGSMILRSTSTKTASSSCAALAHKAGRAARRL